MKICQKLYTAILDKGLRFSLLRSVDYNQGKLINLITVDTNRIADVC